MASTGDAAGTALCFVVDDEPAIGRFVALAGRTFGVAVETHLDVAGMNAALDERVPKVIFLDVALGASDAIEAIRHLATREYPGAVQLMSGRDAVLLDDVRLIGERYGLRMRPPLSKPFRVDAIKRVIDEENLLSPDRPRDGTAADGAAARNRDTPDVDLGEALARGWLEIWYQPKLDLRGAGLCGAEGLARIRHPDLGVVLPASFIPQASSATLLALAEHALRVAVRDAADFMVAGHPTRLAINVPVEALFTLPIVALVGAARREGDAVHSGIMLEVTEDQVIDDIAKAHEVATQLRIHKIMLAIDDFGRGYSSLARLKELPFAELKLDKSFVTGCGNDPDKAALCRMIADLAHRFGSIAVAEGIETPGDLATALAVGCDVAQGFLFARAMPKDVLMTRLVANGISGGFRPVAAYDDGSRATA